VLGLVDVRADRDVWMLYRSVLPHPWGECLVDVYGPDAAAIAVGISGGGVAVLQPAFEARLLGAQTLIDELRRARRHTVHLYVFSLEGCIEAGMLAAVLDADLSLDAAPATLRHGAGLARLGLQTALRFSILAQRAAALFRLQD